MDWGKKWLVHLNVAKPQLISFDRSNNNGSIDVKMGGSVLEGKSFSKMLELTFSFKISFGLLRYLFFLNWDSLHARLNSHYEAWCYKKKNHKKITAYRKSV